MSQTDLLKKIVKECLHEEFDEIRKDINNIKKLFKVFVNEGRKNGNGGGISIKKSPVLSLLEQTRQNMSEDEFETISQTEGGNYQQSSENTVKNKMFSNILNQTAKNMTSEDVSNIGKLE